MADASPFPTYQKPADVAFSRERVTDYLLRLMAEGHQVQCDGEDFVLAQKDGEARLHPVDGKWCVSHTRLGVLSTVGNAGTEEQLNRLLESAVGRLPERPRRGRLDANTPASNYRTIAGLVGSSKVQGVFDTYLDNQSLEQLIHIVSFGSGTFSAQIRLLGTSATTQGGPGRPPRFTKSGVDAWAVQLGIKAEARILPKDNEHRRFLLLDGGQAIILGPSLNSLQKNEAVSIEDDKDDLPFFERQWKGATPLR